jgi:dTDP-4-dehydrorhamnose reductase
VLAESARRGLSCVGTQAASRREGLFAFDIARDRIAEHLPHDFASVDDELVAVVCAAISQPDRCARDPESRRVNVDGAQRLIEDVAAFGGRSIFLSTGFVFDGMRGGYTEDDATAPTTEYGRQKRAIEGWLAARSDALVLRVDKLVGDEPRESHVFSECQARIEAAQPIVCLAGQVFSPIDVADAARAVLDAAARDSRGLYHLAGPEHMAREALVRVFLEVSEQRAEIVLKTAAELGMREPRPLMTWLDASRFGRDVGTEFTPMRSLAMSFVAKQRAA